MKYSGRIFSGAYHEKSNICFSENQLKYKFHEEHPFNPLRLRLTVDLLKEMNALQPEDIVEPRMASDEELKLVHLPNT